MELTVTVNADRRYYPDEGSITNADALIRTICRFNDIKMRLYNCLYDQRVLGQDPFSGGTYDGFLKQGYGTDSYYNCCIYAAAAGALSSQKELRKLYRDNIMEDVKARKSKIASVEKTLGRKQQIKESIRTYAKTGRWVKPYPKCTLKVCGSNISMYGKKTMPLADYERQAEEDIRKLKNRLSMLRHGLSRIEDKLKALTEKPIRRILFGTKGFYRKKDADARPDGWADGLYARRHHSMSLPGRHTSADCNFLVCLRPDGLHVKCMDGQEAVFRDFRLSRYEEEYLGLLARSPAERKAVCYNFRLEKDQHGRQYVIPSVTMALEGSHCCQGFENGCVALDQNWDNITLADLDADGKCLMHKTIPFQLEGKTTGEISCIIGNAMAQAGEYCKAVKKPLVIEDIDTTKKKNGMRYGSRKRNRHASMFAYKKMTACAYSQGYQKGFEVYTIDPSYTSQAAKILYMRKMGCPVHEAAAYTVGLKAMGLDGLLAPPPLLVSLLPQKLRKEGNIWKQWRRITNALRGVRTHLFYGKPPEEGLATLKKPTLKSYAKAMKDRDLQHIYA